MHNLKKSFVTPKNLAILTTVLFVVTLIPLFLLANYVYPCADDYTFGSRCHFVWVETHSVFATMVQAIRGSIDLFFSWAGCLSSSFFMIIQPAVFGDKLYRITPYIMIGIVSIGTTFLLHILGKRLCKDSFWYVQSIAMMFLITVIQCAPGPEQAYFWYNGATHYTLMYGFFTLLCGVIILLLVSEEKKKKLIYALLAIVLGIIVGGGNYLTALNGILLSIFLILGLTLTKKLKKNSILFLPLFFYYLMFALSVLAPGNKVREANSSGMSPIKAVLVSFYYLFNYCFSNWMNWMQILMLVFATIVFWNMAKKTEFTFPYPIFVVVILMGLSAAMMTPCLFGMGNIEAGRITTVVYTVFLLYLLISVCYVTGWVQKHITITSGDISFSMPSQISILLCLGLLAFGTVITMIPEPEIFTSTEAIRELRSGEAAAYRQTMERRSEAYRSGEKDLVVERLEVQPPLLFTSDIQEDPMDWENQGVCRFFNLDSVRVAPETSK